MVSSGTVALPIGVTTSGDTDQQSDNSTEKNHMPAEEARGHCEDELDKRNPAESPEMESRNASVGRGRNVSS